MRLTVRGGHLSSFPGDVPRVRARPATTGHRSDTMHWLMKSEPSECSIDDLANALACTVPWVGVRNHQARNFMRDTMRIGDRVLFYHSSCAEPGIAGVAEVASAAYPDATQFDPRSPYFDPTSAPTAPRWLNVDVKLVRKTRPLPLREMREASALATMQVLRRGNRLSITPVSADEWRAVLALLGTA
jgi:predicted RNA-binding protein with PUA-like domain